MTAISFGPTCDRNSRGRLSCPLSNGVPQLLRRVFFSYHHQRDIWCVNQVRNHGEIKRMHQASGYSDGSLKEKNKTEGRASIKRLIDHGMRGSSVTCVLIGKETVRRHWVDYEIFKSIENGKGVFGVFIHGLEDSSGRIDTRGANPFSFLGYGTSRTEPEKLVPYAKYPSGWKIYEDAGSIDRRVAPYLQHSSRPVLADLFSVYDWIADQGYVNFVTWVQAAAQQAGR